ncbi:unnamed protein product [Phyllotreta striolata]|uniref:Uncharacterized protein n=1 Tax=Phyllotreta striolata TaxID=444603 RepID=A0A9N9XJ55_PHYSR|nr:unnamed protein product [Phyllotreta striolata]
MEESTNIDQCTMEQKEPRKVTKRKFRYIGDFQVSDLECPKKRRLYWNPTQKFMSSSRRKYVTLKTKIHRLKNRINYLSTLLTELTECDRKFPVPRSIDFNKQFVTVELIQGQFVPDLMNLIIRFADSSK